MHLTRSHRPLALALLAGSALVSPVQARTAPRTAPKEALEARMARLEAEVTELRSQLAEARGAQAQAMATAEAAQSSAITAQTAAANAEAKAATAGTQLAALEKKPAPDGIRNGETTLKIGGYLKLIAASTHYSNGSVADNTLGRDFYLPQTIPTTPGGRGFTTEDFTAKQTRLWLNLDTQVAGHVVKGYLETDFQTTASAAPNVTAGGSQRTTNGYTLALRRAFVTVDRFTIGQDWTTFQYVAALPESTDYVGGTEGTVFVRQPLVRYSHPLSKALALHLAVENPESALVTAGATAMLESGTDHIPDFAARLAYTGRIGELSLAGLLRQVRAESTGSALVNNVTTAGAVGNGVTATGFGGSIAGKLFLNEARTGDVRFMATYGQNIGRYVGLNFAPDAIYDPAGDRLTDVRTFAGMVAVRVPLTTQVRINLMGSYQRVHYDQTLAPAAIAGLNRQAWSAAANLFYSPVRQIDLGIEYRHGERELVSGANGNLDRVEFAAKYSF